MIATKAAAVKVKGSRKLQSKALRWIPDHAEAIDFGIEREGGRVSFVVDDDGRVWVEGDPLGRPNDFVSCFDGPAVVNSVRELLDLGASACNLPRAGLRPAGSLSHRAVFDSAKAQCAEREAAEAVWEKHRAQRDG